MSNSKPIISQHAIDQFVIRYLHVKKANQRRREYYENLIYIYLKSAVKIEIPPYIKMEKALKYDRVDGEEFFLNRPEKILFVVVDEVIVTIYHPYNDSQRFQRRSIPSSSVVRKQRKKKRK